MRISDWNSDVCSSDLLEHAKSRAGDKGRARIQFPRPFDQGNVSMSKRTAARRARSWIRAALYLAALVALPLLASPASAAGATAKFPVQRVLGLDAPLQPGDYVWDADGIAPRQTTTSEERTVGKECVHT